MTLKLENLVGFGVTACPFSIYLALSSLSALVLMGISKNFAEYLDQANKLPSQTYLFGMLILLYAFYV